MENLLWNQALKVDNLNHGLPRDIFWHSVLPAKSDRAAQIPDYY